MSDLDEISAFRNRLVTFINYIVANIHNPGPRRSSGPEPAALERIRREQATLTQEYGRLRPRITKAAGGVAMMNLPAIGIVSRDVIVDAINRWD